MARPKVYGPEAPVVYGPEKPPARKAPPRVMHGPEKPPKPKVYGPPPPPRYGPEEAPPVGYGRTEAAPQTPNKSEAEPSKDAYQETMLRLRKKHGGQAPGPWKLDEGQEFETVKTLRGPLALGAMMGQKATEAYMEPAIQEETKRTLERYGNWTGAGAMTAGAGTLVSPAMAPAAIATGGANAATYIAEGLLDARAGRARLGAEKIALGLVDAIMPETNPNAAWLKHWRGVKSAPAYPLAAEVVVNTLQDKLRAYGDETGNKQLSQELRALAADPERLKETIKK